MLHFIRISRQRWVLLLYRKVLNPEFGSTGSSPALTSTLYLRYFLSSLSQSLTFPPLGGQRRPVCTETTDDILKNLRSCAANSICVPGPLSSLHVINLHIHLKVSQVWYCASMKHTKILNHSKIPQHF